MEGVSHHFPLQQGAKVVLFLVEFDGCLLVGALGSRFGVGHQVGGEVVSALLPTCRHHEQRHEGNSQQMIDIQKFSHSLWDLMIITEP